MIRIFLIALATILLLGGGAEAADAEGGFGNYGAGTVSCGEWLKYRKEDSHISNQYQQWVLGFITAYNAHVYDGLNVAEGVNAEGISAWTDKYCREHPLDDLYIATHRLILELESRQRAK